MLGKIIEFVSMLVKEGHAVAYILLLNGALLVEGLRNKQNIFHQGSFPFGSFLTVVLANLFCFAYIVINEINSEGKSLLSLFTDPKYIIAIASFIITLLVIAFLPSTRSRYSERRLAKFYISSTNKIIKILKKHSDREWIIKILGGSMDFLGFVPKNEASDSICNKCFYKSIIWYEKRLAPLKRIINIVFRNKKDCKNCYVKNKQYKQLKDIAAVGISGKLEILCSDRIGADTSKQIYARLGKLLEIKNDAVIRSYNHDQSNQNVRGRIVTINAHVICCWNYRREGIKEYFLRPIKCEMPDENTQMFCSYWDGLWRFGGHIGNDLINTNYHALIGRE